MEGEKEEENTLANSRLAEGEEGKEGASGRGRRSQRSWRE